MKAQCPHSNTGLCETCFKYEQRIAELEEEVKKGMVAVLKLERTREIVTDQLPHRT